jgi:ketosteroid isomerase-like protein
MSNTQIVHDFYTAFQQRDAAAMNAQYAADIVFFDPVFGLLRGDEARSMWEMLCLNALDFTLTFDEIEALDDQYYTCKWVASYTFSKTGKKVVNRIKAHMRIENGKIIEHSDAFSVHEWSKQAFGITGLLFGWSSFFQNKIKNQAKKNLLKYMQSKQ